MTGADGQGRSNQRRRTRKDLLAAAARLMQGGRTPSMDDVAGEAMVSRATAYRYFPSIEALLIEAPLDGAAPTPAAVFDGEATTDPSQRVNRAEAALHEMTCRNDAQLRLMLAASLQRAAAADGDDAVPIRQNRRAALIDAALAPARQRFSDDAYEKLTAALAVLFGIEAMVVFRDVLGLDEAAARRTKQWAIEALVNAAAAAESSPAPDRNR